MGRRGFTLIELMVVVVIIGIIVGLVLVASYEGVNRAQERATQALIAKLDQGINDRLDALMSLGVDPTGAHQFLAAIWPLGFVTLASARVALGPAQRSARQVIAQLDYLKREMPDVFVVDTSNAAYPINFAGWPYPGATGNDMYLLPLGHMARAYRYGQNDASNAPYSGPGDNPGLPTPNFPGGARGSTARRSTPAPRSTRPSSPS